MSEIKTMLGVKSIFPGFGDKGMKATIGIDDENFVSVINNDTYKDKWIILYFYPKDFTFVCPTEIVELDKYYDEFQDYDAQLLGASLDSEFVHKAWRESNEELRNIKTPLIADMGGVLTNKLGIMDPDENVAQRALFIIDPLNIIRYSVVTDLSVGRNSAEVLRVLQALQTDELCPCNWKKGDPTL